MDWTRLDLGVGIIALGSLDQVWSGIEDLVDVVEVEPQTLWPSRVRGGHDLSPEPLAWLRSCGRPLISHGVGFPVGGTTAPDPDGVALSAASMKALGAVHWSEHLAFNVAGDAYAGFLLPPVQTPTAVNAAIKHITDYRRIDDRPFLVETPTNYLQPVDGDLGDGEYVAAIAEGADCGILLDLHNVWTNERNGRQSVEDFIAGTAAGAGLGDAPCRRVRDRRLLPRCPRRPDRPRVARVGRPHRAATSAAARCSSTRPSRSHWRPRGPRDCATFWWRCTRSLTCRHNQRPWPR